MLGATLYDVPLITDTRLSLSPKESPLYLTVERLVLVKEKEVEKVKEEDVKALKKRRG